MIPIPDLDFSDDTDVASPEPTAVVNTELLSLALNSDPHASFMTLAKDNLFYDINNPIYQTKTATLYLARSGNTYYALKTSTNKKLLMKEYQMYKETGDVFTIIQAYDFWIHNDTAFIQLELADGGSINNIIKDMTSNEAKRLFAHIAYAIFQIHNADLIHLDISPSNILAGMRNEQIVYKLVDFGTVIHKGQFGSSCEGAGPYLSPEALQWPNSLYEVGQPADIFSFGLVMYEAVTHKKAPRDTVGYSAIRDGTFDLSAIPEEFSYVRDMLNPNPELRPTISQLVTLPFVTEMISDLLSNMKINEVVTAMCTDHPYSRRESFESL